MKKCYKIFDRLLDFSPVVERALENDEGCSEFMNFMIEELDNVYCTIDESKEDINNVAVKKKSFQKADFSKKIIIFIHSSLLKFVETDKVKGIPTSKKLIDNLKGIMRNKTHINHSHISGEITGYTHSYCNQDVRENKSKISVVPHNLFRFDFFFLLKDSRAGVSRTRDISIGSNNPTNINFANISNQVMFLDTIKYFQQSLGALASNLTEKLIRKDENLAKKFNLCSKED